MPFLPLTRLGAYWGRAPWQLLSETQRPAAGRSAWCGDSAISGVFPSRSLLCGIPVDGGADDGGGRDHAVEIELEHARDEVARSARLNSHRPSAAPQLRPASGSQYQGHVWGIAACGHLARGLLVPLAAASMKGTDPI